MLIFQNQAGLIYCVGGKESSMGVGRAFIMFPSFYMSGGSDFTYSKKKKKKKKKKVKHEREKCYSFCTRNTFHMFNQEIADYFEDNSSIVLGNKICCYKFAHIMFIAG